MTKVKFGIVGLGRLGIQHAKNIATKISGAELIAICSIDEKAMNEFKTQYNIKYSYTNFDDMLFNSEIDALFICSPSGLHCNQIKSGLEAGFHVFSEKPLGTTLEECEIAVESVEKHPDKIFMLGFMRRYDESYMYAKKMISSGEIGVPILFRGYSQDPETAIEGAIAYAGHSGGEFIDMSVHDIDLARWLMSSEPSEVWAIGGCYAHPEFAKYNDGDNVAALLKFKNSSMGFLFAGRTAPHGYNVETEIIGTKGILRIASVPQKNLVEILDSSGVRKECSQNFLERFEAAYLNEVQEFVNCILNGKQPEVTVNDGLQATKIAYACKKSFEEQTLVKID